MRKTLSALLALFMAGSVLGKETLSDGWAAYNSGDFNKAYDIFMGLFKEDPDNTQLNYALGMAALTKGKLSHALFAFERVLIKEPGNQRARLELAWTYLAMEQYELARREFETVQASHPPENVQHNIDKYLEHIRKVTSPWSVDGLVNLSVFYDDNVNYGPSSRMIDSLIGDLEVSTNNMPIESWGLSAGGTIQGTYDAGSKRHWLLTGGAGAYQNFLFDATEQEIGYVRLNAGLRRTERKSLLEIPFKFDHLDYGHESLVDIAGVDPFFLYEPTVDWNLVTAATLEHRQYDEGDLRDGPYFRLSQTARKFFCQKRHNVSLTLGYAVEDSDDQVYANEGPIVISSIDLLIWTQTQLYGIVEYHRYQYGEEILPDLQEDARLDDQWQYVVGLRKTFDSRWGVDFNWRHVNNESNFGLYNYERNIVSLNTFLMF